MADVFVAHVDDEYLNRLRETALDLMLDVDEIGVTPVQAIAMVGEIGRLRRLVSLANTVGCTPEEVQEAIDAMTKTPNGPDGLHNPPTDEEIEEWIGQPTNTWGRDK